MFSVAREAPSETSGIDGCKCCAGTTSCACAFSHCVAFATVFTSRSYVEEPVDALP